MPCNLEGPSCWCPPIEAGTSGQAGHKRFVIRVSKARVGKVEKEWVWMDEHEKTYITCLKFLICQLSFLSCKKFLYRDLTVLDYEQMHVPTVIDIFESCN